MRTLIAPADSPAGVGIIQSGHDLYAASSCCTRALAVAIGKYDGAWNCSGCGRLCVMLPKFSSVFYLEDDNPPWDRVRDWVDVWTQLRNCDIDWDIAVVWA